MGSMMLGSEGWGGTRAASIAALLLLAACATAGRPPEPEEKFTTVPVIVGTGCVAEGGRPAPVTPLNQLFTRDTWAAKPPGAKAQAVRAQAGRRMNQADDLAAATSACR